MSTVALVGTLRLGTAVAGKVPEVQGFEASDDFGVEVYLEEFRVGFGNGDRTWKL